MLTLLVFTFLFLFVIGLCTIIFKLVSDKLKFQTLHRCGAWKVCRVKDDEDETYSLLYGKEVRSQSSDLGVIFEAYKHVTTESRKSARFQRS